MRVRSGVPGSPAPPPLPNGRPAGPRRTRDFTVVLGEQAGLAPAPAPARATARPPATAARPPAGPDRPPPSPVRDLLDRTLGAERRVDTLLAAAASGKTFSPGELLALQATVFRYSQAVEVVSRATDKLVGAVKQTIGTQV
jgi:hypothetical protein